MRNQANVGLNHGPGKGDKSRTVFNADWRAKFSEIHWPPAEGFVRRGNKLIKRYG